MIIEHISNDLQSNISFNTVKSETKQKYRAEGHRTFQVMSFN
jgi:hypothetical protein